MNEQVASGGLISQEVVMGKKELLLFGTALPGLASGLQDSKYIPCLSCNTKQITVFSTL